MTHNLPTGASAWDFANAEAASMETHCWAFEIWPPDASEKAGKVPILLPDHTPRIYADSPRRARQIAAERYLPDGWAIGAGSHIRSRCTPPHSGDFTKDPK